MLFSHARCRVRMGDSIYTHKETVMSFDRAIRGDPKSTKRFEAIEVTDNLPAIWLDES